MISFRKVNVKKSEFPKLEVKKTDVTSHPSYDFIVIMNERVMKKNRIKENDYILIKNILSFSPCNLI